jgi:hypothetical protein
LVDLTFLVAKDESEKRADAIYPKTLTVPLLRAITAIKVIVLILSASFHLGTVIAPGVVSSREPGVISLVIVPAKVHRLIIAIPTAPLRRYRQSHRSHQHQSH